MNENKSPLSAVERETAQKIAAILFQLDNEREVKGATSGADWEKQKSDYVKRGRRIVKRLAKKGLHISKAD